MGQRTVVPRGLCHWYFISRAVPDRNISCRAEWSTRRFRGINCLLATPPDRRACWLLFSEVVSNRQWAGLFLGFVGTAFVVDVEIEDLSYSVGLIWAVLGLVAVTSATLLQKRFSGRVPLATNNFYQAGAATLFHVLVVLSLEPVRLNFTDSLVLAIGWQIVAVSFGAFSILMYLLAQNSASETVAWLFLVPPLAAIFSWFLLGESLEPNDFIGFATASAGVYLATRGK